MPPTLKGYIHQRSQKWDLEVSLFRHRLMWTDNDHWLNPFFPSQSDSTLYTALFIDPTLWTQCAITDITNTAFSFILSSKFVRYCFNAEVEMSKMIIMDSERERCLCLFWISSYEINVYCVFVVPLWILCLCFRLCALKQLVQWWQVEGSWRAEYPWLGPRPHRPPSSTDHRCPCLRISDWLWIQSCIGTSTYTHWM